MLEMWLLNSLLVAVLALTPIVMAALIVILWRSRTRSWRAASMPVARGVAIPLAVVGVLIFALRPNQFPLTDMYVNLEPFRDLRTSLESNSLVDIAIKNVLGNAAMFVPVGVAAAFAFPGGRLLGVLVATTCLSVMIEVAQTLPVIARSADVTDVIMNAVGAAIGFAVVRRLIRMNRRRVESAQVARRARRPLSEVAQETRYERLALRLRPGADPGERACPVRIEWHPRLVEVDRERCVVGRDRRALARLAVDLGVDDPRRDRWRRQQVIDAHPEVLVEVAGPVVPPRETSRLVVHRAIAIDEPEIEQAPERGPLRLGDVGPAVDRGLVPDILRGRRDIEVATQDERVGPGRARPRSTAGDA